MTTQPVKLIGPSQRDYAYGLLAEMPDGAVVTFKPEPKRSDDQNAKMWAMIRDVLDAGLLPQTKGDPDVAKAIFMKACDHEIRFVMGIDGEPFPMGYRSSHLTVRQMADLITFIQWYGDTNDVRWREVERRGYA